jgi:hypothetical protein
MIILVAAFVVAWFVCSQGAAVPDFPQGTATLAEECGACHRAIYREFATGFGGDLKYPAIVYRSGSERPLTIPANVSSTGTAHALAGVDPLPIHARDVDQEGRSCNVCHFPEPFEIPAMEDPEIGRPKPRPKSQEATGLTCSSCHLTPDGKIRGPHVVTGAPHETVADPRTQTSAMCAYCHSLGKRVAGKQTQTFLEWRDDFNKSGLGSQQCQDCHMFRTLRKTAEDFNTPVRPVARHLWTGGHSAQRLQTALNLVVVQPAKDTPSLELHVINIGAGHSVPTGSSLRAIYLIADIVDSKTGKTTKTQEWMFAPWYGDRPDDRAFLEEDKKRPDAKTAMQADEQGPHEAIIRAGEERILTWSPELKPGEYTVQARLVSDLNRYNDRSFLGDQTEMGRVSLPINVSDKR